MKNILIVKTSSLGDIIHAFPTVDYLREKFPEVNIDWVVEEPFKALLESHPKIRRVITMNTKEWRKRWFSGQTWRDIMSTRQELQSDEYDVVFDLQGNCKSGLITWQANSSHKVGFAWDAVAEKPNLFFTHHRYSLPRGKNIRTDYLTLVQNYFQDFETKSHDSVLLRMSESEKKRLNEILSTHKGEGTELVMVCPGSRWKNKQLDMQTWIDFLQMMQRDRSYCFLFLWGNEEEHRLAEQLSKFITQSVILEKLSIPALQNLMAQLDLVIAVDSLPLHLAGTTAVRTFSLFGPSSAQKYRPKGNCHSSLQGTCPYGLTFENRCPILRTCSTGACLKNLTGEVIYRAFHDARKTK